MNKHLFIIIFFLLNTKVLLSQTDNIKTKTTNMLLNEYMEKKCEVNFDSRYCKSFNFYKNQEFDSCYVYSNSILNSLKSTKDKDVFNYILGVSALNKGLYKKALVFVKSISKDNPLFKDLKPLKLAEINLVTKSYKRSIEHYKQWEKNNSSTDIDLKIVAYHNFGLNYLHIKDYDNAKIFFSKKEEILNRKDTAEVISSKMELANAYYEQYLDNEAIPLFEEAYNLAKKFSNIKLKQNSAQNMAVIERNRKNYKESVIYYQEFIKWKDSLWNRDRIIELADRDKKLTVAQKDKEIAVQDEKLKRKEVVQRGLLFGASGLLLFIGALGFFYSKLRKQNTLITQQKEDLAIANKTKNYLFSVVSHDLRSPMNTIKYQHEQLKKHIETNNLEGIKEANNTAITVTESTSHLLNNVLHWSLEQSNQMVFAQKAYPLKPIVEHVLYDYENLIEANAIEISTNYIQNSIVNADRESIKIVLRNILDNAVKYMNGEGKITVEIGVDNENYSYVSIQDTGIGIPKDRLEKINALKGVSIDKIDRSEGVGLGLILCQTLVKKNKGILSFDSEVGKGTKVTIQLPIADE